MPTYSGNAYELLTQVRLGLNEYSTGLVQGTDATGKFQNPELMRHINNAQYFLWEILFKQFPEYFLKSSSITFTSSTATLPSDCFKLRELSDSRNYPISPILANQRHITGNGSSNLYYRYGNTVRIDQDGINDTGTVWYYSRCRELDTGVTSAGGAASATLATTAKALADYYNGVSIENVTDSTVDTITDYTAARVCTVTNTWAASKYYGTVCELPEVFQPIVATRAILTMKMSPRVPVPLVTIDKSVFIEELQSAMQAFAGTKDGDQDVDSLFNDFEAMQ